MSGATLCRNILLQHHGSLKVKCCVLWTRHLVTSVMSAVQCHLSLPAMLSLSFLGLAAPQLCFCLEMLRNLAFLFGTINKSAVYYRSQITFYLISMQSNNEKAMFQLWIQGARVKYLKIERRCMAFRQICFLPNTQIFHICMSQSVSFYQYNQG